MAKPDPRHIHAVPSPPPQGDSLLGDLTKGGRPATDAERLRLAGLNSDGVPQGLTQCPVCAEWRGSAWTPARRSWAKSCGFTAHARTGIAAPGVAIISTRAA